MSFVTANKYSELVTNLSRDLKIPGNQLHDIAIALYAAYNAQLPSEPVASVPLFYNEHVHESISNKISVVQEYTSVNYETAARMAHDIWHARYNMLHDPINADSVALLGLATRASGSCPDSYVDTMRAVAHHMPMVLGQLNQVFLRS